MKRVVLLYFNNDMLAFVTEKSHNEIYNQLITDDVAGHKIFDYESGIKSCSYDLTGRGYGAGRYEALCELDTLLASKHSKQMGLL